MTIPTERPAIRCSRCEEIVHRVVTPPLPPKGTWPTPPSGPVCERCLAEIEREYTEDRQAARAAPGPAAIRDVDEMDPGDPDATVSEDAE
jgi:hypothetical protein